MGHFLRKNWLRRGVAVLAAAATLAGGSLAFAADGGGGHGDGVHGSGSGGQIKWAYRDSWGGVDDNIVRSALQSMGLTVIGSADATNAIHQATVNARNDCNTRAHRDGLVRPQCRLVAVGAVHTPNGGGSGTDNFTGHSGGFSTADWQNAYHAAGIDNGHYTYHGIPYDTHTYFSDHRTNINILAGREMGDASIPGHNANIGNTALILIALNQNEPPQPNYHLNISTSASGQSPQAGAANPVHDRIVTSLNRNEHWSGSSVKLDVWLNWDGYPATNNSRKAVSKQVTITGTGTVNSPDFTPRDFGWNAWAPGRYWYDISAGKQGNMAGGVNTSDRQASETFSLKPGPTIKKLTRMNGQEMDGQLVPGTMYMAHVTGTVTPAVSGYNTRATITDHIMSKDVWVGASDHDDLTEVTVSHDGRTVTSGVHVTKTDTADGYDVTATITNPAEGEYTLNIPSTIKALTGNGKDKTNETIKDQGCIIPNTGARQVCSDTKQEQGEHPETSKAWQLKDGKLVEDKDWTNHVGADGMTFLPGDPVSASQLNSQPMVHRNHAVFRQTKGSAQESRDPAEPLLFA